MESLNEITIQAPAKINLALDVTGRRTDGYHLLRMVMQSVSLSDTLHIRRSSEDCLHCDVQGVPLDGRNLALKAWQLMKKRFSLSGGLEIFLEKKIPMAGGLAGGSSDAAAVLRGVNRLFKLGLDNLLLAGISLELGADVPFCVTGETALAEGIGEILTPLPVFPRMWAVLVNPGFGVSTVEVYRRFDSVQVGAHPDISAMVQAIHGHQREGILKNLSNVLEYATFAMHPELALLKKELAAMDLLPLMSGSGPTFFAFAQSEEKAREAAAQLSGRWRFVTTVSTI